MQTPTPVTVTSAQYRVLADLDYAVSSMRNASMELAKAAQQTTDSLDAGQRPFGLSHQTPKDYWVAEAKFETLLSVVHTLEIDADLVDRIVKGGNLWSIVIVDDGSVEVTEGG